MTSEQYHPRYPLYIISKGRAEYQLTSKNLSYMGIPHRIAVEPQDYDSYAREVGEDKLLVLPFSNHGKGSGPARNWVWEHSIEEGHDRHWVIDDNIYCFYRFHHNRRVITNTGAGFRTIEDFVDRYTNVALAGPQYKFFCMDDYKYNPVKLNTRLMSCILIKNDIDQRWRCRYNEDVDLSLRVLKDGWSTMLFYHFLQMKARTGTIKGGNTQELYGAGTYEKSKMLAMLHPDVVRLADRYGRDHHHVDIRPFQHIMPQLRDDISLDELPKVNEYGMMMVRDWGTDTQYVTESKPRAHWK